MDSIIRKQAASLSRTGRLSALRGFRQHGVCTVWDHSLGVASLALRLARRLRLRVDEASLVRGALLHDYFLYDWHVADPDRPLHGFYHPRAALENARRDYPINVVEADIIARHMFPLTPLPPRTREGLLVCLADKLCAVRETAKGLASGRARGGRRRRP